MTAGVELPLSFYGATTAWSVSIMTASTLLGKVALAAIGDRMNPRHEWAVALAMFGWGWFCSSPVNTLLAFFRRLRWR